MSDAAVTHESHGHVAHQFETAEQQREAGQLGMWLFLMTEILFFGGMFTAYTVYRLLHISAFELASRDILEAKYGATNTAVLICSSLTMAMSIHSAHTGKKKWQTMMWLVFTMILGLTFLGIKLRFEWYEDYIHHFVPGLGFQYRPEWASLGSQMGQVQMFMCFYFFMTGLHALHMVIGLGILTVLLIMTARDRFSPNYVAPLEISGLYWHFVDIVWIFLFPLLYLVGGRYPH